MESKSEELRKQPRLEEESNLILSPNVVLTEADHQVVVFQGPVASLRGVTYTSKFESAIKFEVRNLNSDKMSLRFRINFQIVEI